MMTFSFCLLDPHRRDNQSQATLTVLLISLAWAQGPRVRLDHSRTCSMQAFSPSEGWKPTSGDATSPHPLFFSGPTALF